jgi:Putative Ig domain/Protein of unknown function (DUF4054)
MSFPPSVSDFKAQFPSTRVFLYGTGPGTVMDSDIQNALNIAYIDFNPGLWDTKTPIGNTTEGALALNYLAAHFLVVNVQGDGGLTSVPRGRAIKNQGSGIIESKSIGSVSVSMAILNLARESPILGPLLETSFGKIYLKLLYPRLVGNVAVVGGGGFGYVGPILGLMNIAPLQITTLSLAGGTHNVAYAGVVNANGGVGQYTWTIASGSLPTGLTLAPLTGIISGTPTVAGTYYFEVRCLDIMGNTAAQNYQVVIA